MLLGQSDFVIEDIIQVNLPHFPKMTTTHSVYQSNMNFLVQQPKELQPEYNIAFVLDKATWVCFFTSWLIVILLFGTISKMNVRAFLSMHNSHSINYIDFIFLNRVKHF